MVSARNRGSDARRDPPKLEASQNGAELALRKGIAGGFSPVVVALEVFEAIRDERFYILLAQPERSGPPAFLLRADRVIE